MPEEQSSEKVETKSTGSDAKVIHIKIIGGTYADILTIGEDLKKFSKTLPYKLHAVMTNENIELRDVDTLLKEFYKLKKELEKVEKDGTKKMSDMSK